MWASLPSDQEQQDLLAMCQNTGSRTKKEGREGGGWRPWDRLRTARCRDREAAGGHNFLWADLASNPSCWDHHVALVEPQWGGWLRAQTLDSTGDNIQV